MAVGNLEDLQPQKISRSLKGKYVFLYGPPKVGKTSMVASYKDALIFAFEPGYNAVTDAYIQPVLSWSEFKQYARQLSKPANKEKFQYIGIDTADIAFDLCESFICQQNGVTKLGDIPWGGGYSMLNKEFSKVLREIAQLGYGLIFISHETKKPMKDAKGVEYELTMPAAPTRCRDIVNKLVDFIIYLGVEYPNPEDTIGVRYMQMRGTKEVVAGSRFQHIPERIGFGYQSLEDAVLAAIDKQVGTNTSLITDEQDQFYTESNLRPFEEAMDEAKELWVMALNISDTDETAERLNKIVEGNFNKKIKLSSVSEDQQELLELTIVDLKDFLKQLSEEHSA